jgi:D-glycero-alpha-D-manno-heptose-7-phosphate kinase
MIITKAPMRISFAGGGTDLADFYRNEGYGAVVSTTINKYVYLAIHASFDRKFLLKYSQTEHTDTPEEIHHPLIREALLLTETKEPLEITSFADIPAKGSGLGSSSAFCVAIITTLYAMKGRLLKAEESARMACQLEIERLKEPIGKQDQYATAVGGLNYIRFNADESVEVERIILLPESRRKLEKSLLLFYTGITREARSILGKQQEKTAADAQTRKTLRKMRDLADSLRESLRQQDVDQIGRSMHEGWLLKREVADGITSPLIDGYYDKAIAAGALGGKLLGAGGGGFLIFYVPEEKQAGVRAALADLREIEFCFETQGVRITHIDN